MKITSSKFITSATSVKQIPAPGLPEIAISGRSNVGKSSLINYILNRKGLAKTSGSPGKTRFLNYFLINEKFYLVDLPGYGYAKVSKEEQNKWKEFMEKYFQESEQLKLVLQLIDIRHELKKTDQMMLEYFDYYQVPHIIILTKTDKLGTNKLQQQKAYFKRLLKDKELILTSSFKKTGKKEVINHMAAFLNEKEGDK